MTAVDVAVVGAGVVGLAITRRLARAGLEVVLLDGERSFGSWTSSRNSEVIHAGIYYPSGSLKARLCVEGRRQLYDFCERTGVPHRRCGKLIFAATAEETPALDGIERAAADADVTDLVRLDRRSAQAIEPAIDCHEALLSPSTGIIDSHAYMTALLAQSEDAGALLVLRSRVERLSLNADGSWGVHLPGEPEPALDARFVVNAAGLAAHRLARNIEGLDPAHVPNVRFARGVYFTYGGHVPFDRLIYPVPVPGGLGTHLTLDMSGAARFGPDVEWIDEIDYHVDPARYERFLAAARLLWPAIDPTRLAPGYAGIRPKLGGPGEPAADFAIEGEEVHGMTGLVNLFGIESPGLTASLAIADEVAARLHMPASAA